MKELIPTFLCLLAAFSVIAAYVLHTRRRPKPTPPAATVTDEQALAIVTMGFSSGSITALTNRGWPPLLARAMTANTIDALRADPLMREELIVMARDALAHPDLNPARAGQHHTVKIHAEEP